VAAVLAGAHDYLLKGQVKGEMLGRALAGAIERSRIERELKERDEQYRDLFEGALGFICVHDLDGRLTAVNPAAAEALGSTPSALVGTNLREIVTPKTREGVSGYLQRIQSLGVDTGVLHIRTRSGAERVWEYRNRLRRPVGRPPYVVSHAADVTERRSIENELREASRRDPLTGVHNRRYLEQLAQDRELGPEWACLVIDVDHFKAINDSQGHAAGDEILVRLARYLGARLRVGDALVRLGGDEFLLLLNHGGQSEADALIARLRADGDNAPVSFSVGVGARDGREPLETTIRRADRALYSVRAAERSGDRRRKPGA